MNHKILFILHHPPPIHGSSVVGGFIKESKVINNTFECRFINLGTSYTVEEIGRKSFRKILFFFSLVWQVKKQLILFKPDLCYLTINSQCAGFYKDSLIVLLVRIFGVKPVYHFHNKGVSSRQDKFFDNLLYNLVFWKSHVILLSKSLYQDISKYVPESRVYYCPNGIPDRSGLSAQGTGRRAESGEQGAGTEILFLSHLIESKGVFVLIDACNILQEKNIDFHCIIAGGEAELTREEVEDVISEKDLSSYIKIVGPKHSEEKMRALSEADIFVLPTFYHKECMPLVLLEAMQHSLPVVSTFEGAIPDVVEDGITGFLVPQKDSAALAEKLEILITDTGLRRSMGAAGRIKYEQVFTMESFECRLQEILKEVIKGKE